MLTLAAYSAKGLRIRGYTRDDDSCIDLYIDGQLLGTVSVVDVQTTSTGRNGCPRAKIGFEGFKGVRILRREIVKQGPKN